MVKKIKQHIKKSASHLSQSGTPEKSEAQSFRGRFSSIQPRALLGGRSNFFYAVLVHVVFLAILLLGFQWEDKPSSRPKVNVIDAVVVDEARVLAELDKLKKLEQRKDDADKAREKKLKREEKRLADLKKKKTEEQRRLKKEREKRKREEKRTKELEKTKKAETEKLNKLKTEQKRVEKKRLDEQQRLDQLRKDEVDRAKKKQEQKRKAEIERQRLESERALQEQLAAEQQLLEAESERQAQGVVDKYIEIIKQKVTRNWLRPAASKKGLACKVLVRLIPGGEVVEVRIISSSGDASFDRSVETAVLKASPLPLPPDPLLFERFRELKFLFSPEE